MFAIKFYILVLPKIRNYDIVKASKEKGIKLKNFQFSFMPWERNEVKNGTRTN